MTRERAKELFELAVNPDRAPDALSELRAGVDELFTENDTFRENNETLNNQITQLREVNLNLFLRMGKEQEDTVIEEEEKEPTRDEILASFVEEDDDNG